MKDKTLPVRTKKTLCSKWLFYQGNIEESDVLNGSPADWIQVNIPHTWNKHDLIKNDGTEYYRGVGWYQKHFFITENDRGKKVYLFFDGANQDAKVFVNGELVGEHFGGYTAFCFDITQSVRYPEKNHLVIRLSNAHNESVAPLGGDLGHFGGIYRQVYLVTTNKIYFDPGDAASPGILVDTPEVSKKSGKVRVRAHITNETANARDLLLTSIITDANGNIVTTMEKSTNHPAGDDHVVTMESEKIESPHLWSPDTPYLYQVRTIITDSVSNEIYDELVIPFGFRWFSIDAEKGFFLNGEHYFIRGVGKHQDYGDKGYAVPYHVLENDVRWIKRVGANCMRGHYPLVSSVYDTTDRIGVLNWVKLPIMDRITATHQFRDNAKHMVREMVLQHYNHPSIIVWGQMCEVFGDMDWFWPKPQDPARVKREMHHAYQFSKDLHEFTKTLDSLRLIANDFHIDPNPQWYEEARLTEINDINGWNLYQGWYQHSLDHLPVMVEKTHSYAPQKPYIIAEYGAGTDTRIHTYDPTIFDFSTEYAEKFHKVYLATSKRYPWLAGMMIWTLFDFQRTRCGDTMKHANNKGLLTGDRVPKDTFYLYKVHWNPEPMVYIATHNWAQRIAFADKNSTVTIPIKVYSNLPEVELFHNGKSSGTKKIDDYEAIWDVACTEGDNALHVSAPNGNDICSDFVTVNYTFLPQNLKEWNDTEGKLCINVGQSRTYYVDPVTEDRWVPDQVYKKGSFGHRDGDWYRVWNDMPAWQGIRDGVSTNIAHTENVPVFQTFLVGITNYQIDVSDGQYRVTLYFTEPFQYDKRTDPEEKTGADIQGVRVFDVTVNDTCVFENCNLAELYGECEAVMEAVNVTVKDDRGISIQLTPRKGKPILSGILVERL